MPSAYRLACDQCSRTFKRPEHLKRHARVHSDGASFWCVQCQKSFNRSDVFQRHLLTHDVSEPSLLKKGARACRACALARVRCSGDQPCRRCSSKSSTCAYPGGNPDATANEQLIEREVSEQDNSLDSDEAIHEQSLDQDAVICEGPPLMDPTSLGGSSISAAAQWTALDAETLSSQAPPSAIPAQTASQYNHTWTSPVLFSNSHTVEAQPSIVEQHVGIDAARQGYDSMTPGINWLAFSPVSSHEVSMTSNLMDLDGLDLFQDSIYRASDSFMLWQTEFTTGPRIPPAGFSDLNERVEGSTPSHQTVEDINEKGSFGEYYVDGEEGRLPRVKPRKENRSHLRNPDNHTQQGFTFEALNERNLQNTSLGEVATMEIELEDYATIHGAFRNTCLLTERFARFESPAFLSKVILEHLVSLYWSNFSPLLPILHRVALSPSQHRWIVILAMATIGSQYCDYDIQSQLMISMNELLRRVLLSESEDLDAAVNMDLIQATLLNCIGMLYSGDDRLYKFGLQSRQRLSDLASHYYESFPALRRDESSPTDWVGWLHAESCRRTWYGIWLLDTMWKFHFQKRPLWTLEACTVSLPCHEEVWASTCSAELSERRFKFGVSSSLLATLQNLYLEKRLDNNMGEYSKIIIIHGLFRRSWEVEVYYRQPLSQWEPTAAKQSSNILGPPTPRWLPSIPTYRKWRNSACDCLDVLHWKANAMIGNNANMEHPTVMHLHLARVILLAPYENILTLAKLKGRVGPEESAHMTRESHIISLWVTRDQYKARLAIIHAGVLLWHLRRYSASGYYEAPSVLLATLTLWGYATFFTGPNPGAGPHGRSPEEISDERRATHPDDVDVLPLIHLDRPTDDELVQLFIRQGSAMHANLSGVGDIRGSNAPTLILRTGRKLLSQLRHWGTAEKCHQVLDNLLAQEIM